MNDFARNSIERERLQRIGEAAAKFPAEAQAADKENRLSWRNIELLKDIGYPAWPVPAEYGGLGISLYELVLYQERLAQADPATALGIGWHVGIVFDLAHKRPWNEEAFAGLCRAIVQRGALTNRMASEAASGSPSRGGRPRTTATPQGDYYRINGRKNYATLAPAIDYYIVSAVLEGTEEQGEFLIPRHSAGLSVEETWDMLGMRGTASHDLVLNDVLVPRDALVHKLVRSDYQAPSPYLLHIPACYLGIALAARREALRFAKHYQPNSLSHPILYAPNVAQLLGQIELSLRSARHFVYSIADRWDNKRYDHPVELSADLGAAKTVAVQAAMHVVDLALRITGSHGLHMHHPLQRYYRDVRFGLHNPPMDDTVVAQLAKLAVAEAESLE